MINNKIITVVAGLVVLVLITSGTIRSGGDDFKNLQVLPKNISVDSLDAIMDSYKKALGVKCGFCHVMRDKNGLEDYASDDNRHKNQARDMMRMTMDINKKYFPSDAKYIERVTCNTCHQGHSEPPENELH